MIVCTSLWARALDTIAFEVPRAARALVAALDKRKEMPDRLRAILIGRVPGSSLCELFGALWMLSLGVWLLLPFDTFTWVRDFAILERVSVEWLWGVALTAVALWRLDALIMNRIQTRRGLTMMAVVTWSSLAPILIISNIASPGGVAYLVFALLEMVTYRNVCDESAPPSAPEACPEMFNVPYIEHLTKELAEI